jgi:hypothetical protein
LDKKIRQTWLGFFVCSGLTRDDEPVIKADKGRNSNEGQGYEGYKKTTNPGIVTLEANTEEYEGLLEATIKGHTPPSR